MDNKIESEIVKCIYCGAVGELTRDHVPPKNIFPSPRPENIITVPSCYKCNSDASKDDEYFRNMLTLRYDIFEHPEANKNWQKVLRSIKRSESKQLRKAILRNMKPIDLITPSGIFVGKSGIYYVEIGRLLNTVNRIIKGIFFHEFGHSIPSNYSVRSFMLELIRFDDDVINLITIAKGGNTQAIGNEIFQYWIRKTDEDSNSTVSLLLFFNRVSFYGFTFLNEK